MVSNKKIRISEENRKLLHQIKGVGQSYDEVIEKLLKEHWEKNREKLFNRIEENSLEDFTSLEELD